MQQVVTVLALALSMLIGSAAMARDGDGHRSFDRGHSYRHDGRHNGYRGQRDFRRRDFDSRRHFERDKGGFYGDRRFSRDRKFYGDRKFGERRFYGERKFYGGRFERSRFSHRSWRRGDRLPSVFLSTRFVVNDFRSFNLYRPPRGYRWVRVERDAFLAGVATGVVIAVVADRF